MLEKIMKTKTAFTLVELSVVVVIISIMLSTVLVSKTLIDSVKVNKIQEDARMLNISVQLFFDRYGCLPGDCMASQIPDLVAAGLNSLCTTATPYVLCSPGAPGCEGATPLGTGAIETATKRTCMMYELQFAAFINSVTPSYSTLTDSIAGKNIPYAKFSSLSAWDFRIGTQSPGPGPAVSYDFVSGLNTIPVEFTWIPQGSWGGRHYFLLRDANTATGIVYDMSNNFSSGPQPSISAKLAYMLDLKFDDGMPYTGNIMSGLNSSNDFIFASASTGSLNVCTTISTTQMTPNFPIPNAILADTYLQSNTIANGCLVGFLINTPH